MTNNKSIGLSLLGAVMVLAGIFGYKYYINTPSNGEEQTTSHITAKTVVGQRRPDFSLLDTDDKSRSIKEWDGKVILLNFWATWCPPCRREIPAFIELQEAYRDKGLVIVGVALDTKQAAIDFVDPMGINYPILVGEIDGINLTQQYGNDIGVLPYSVIIDREGVIRQSFRHEVTYDEAEKLISPYL